MTIFKTWIAVTLVMIPTAILAFTPESGFYNLFTSDAQGGEGTGLAVDIQNDYMFAAGFVYRPDGAPTFVTIEGQLEHRSNGSWGLRDDHGLYRTSGGQCIGSLERCPYRKTTVESIGGFSIEFSAENEGTIEWGAAGNRAFATLRRTCAGTICYDAPSSLLGEWDVILDRAMPADQLRFGGDKLAITDVSPSGDARRISGCVAQSESAAPDCSKRVGAQLIEGAARRCFDTACFGGYRYRLFIHAANCTKKCKIVRVYTFSENGDGGAFSGSIRGKVSLCPQGADSADACAASKNLSFLPFVAYRSGSVNFVRTGEGMN